MGLRENIPLEKFQAVPNYRDSDLFTELEKNVIEFAERLTSTPSDVPDELYEALASAMSPAQLVELAEVIATENHRARFNRAFNVGSQEFVKLSRR